MVVLSVVSNLLMLTGPLFMLQVYDRVLASRSVPTLVVLTILIAGLFAFYAFLDAMRSRMSARFANVLDSKISGRLLSAGIRMRLSAGNRSNLDPVRDGDAVRQFLASPVPLTLLDLPWVPFYLGLVFLFHPWLGWLAVGGSLVVVMLMIANEVLSKHPAKETTSQQQLRQRQADDVRLNAETVVAMGMGEALQRRWSKQTDRMLSAQVTAGDRAAFFSATTKGLRFFLQSAVLALGAYLVIQGSMTAGLMIAASVVTARGLAPVEQIVGQWRAFVTARQSWARIKVVLNNPERNEREVELSLPRQTLTVRGLATAPQGSKSALVGGVSFDLSAGEAVGVLGPSGSGKSSLAKGLLDIWPHLAGEVRFDGAPLSHYRSGQIGRICGYLPQRVELFDGSVAENISRFAAEADSEQIIAAAMTAGAHELISSLPDGYNTRVGEQGDLLSAGQRQRIGLARAVFGSPFLIVLDEPNSNLDSEGEAALSAAIQKMKERGSVVIVVAHRPSALNAVDKVLFVQNGRQAAFGPKDEVLKKIVQPAQNVLPIKVPAQ
ncbi:type I secretion system permease/ATPase [Devosia sp. Leaf64]|uniref:type I secretion system permease/ATPase n=1 Tax=Devosia sp. Leaf64 TaxID=1736229 RepID=UPI0007158A18|nr:type I secretion system permease/ATPase [Devosia sp. Leaf64]KQN77510.1 type I secretion protein [Devosia sp. Leaf64]